MFSSSSVTSVVGLRPINVSSARSGYRIPSNSPFRMTSTAPAMAPLEPRNRPPVFGRVRNGLETATRSEAAVIQCRKSAPHALLLLEIAVRDGHAGPLADHRSVG